MIEIVDAHNFLRSIRETGYRSLAHNLAEFVDNSLQAQASTVSISVGPEDEGTIRIIDDGTGMTRRDLRTALQFGGSTRFNDRKGLGRFGMGLPTSSLSLAKRVDVYTWRSNTVFHSFLDVEELGRARAASLPEPKRVPRPSFLPGGSQGTAIQLSRCDRAEKLNERGNLDQTKFELRRIFRYALQDGLTLLVNGELLRHFDPLFLFTEHLSASAAPYGPVLRYELPVRGGPALIEVRFSVLPVAAWRNLPNAEKQTLGIARGAGVSVVRNEREIAYGWYFMGSKRRENYDDWWRCEVCFDPELDERFGVNHTKQQISPTLELDHLLSPDLENIARILNMQVRQEFVRTAQPKVPKPAKAASERDKYLPAITTCANEAVRGLDYQIEVDQHSAASAFFRTQLTGSKLAVLLNPNHPMTTAYLTAKAAGGDQVALFEYALLSAARVELGASSDRQRWWFRTFKAEWSDALAAFLGN